MKYILTGTVTGAVLSGLIESFVKLPKAIEYPMALPVSALFYYGLFGLIFGLTIGSTVAVFLSLRSGSVTHLRLFGIFAAASSIFSISAYLLEFVFVNRFTYPINLLRILKSSALIFAIFIIAFGLYYYLFKFLSLRSRKPLAVLIMAYFAALAITGGLAILSAPANEFPGRTAEIPVTSASSMSSSKPNIIFILIDALRRDRISPYGCRINTPTIQQVADDGILCTNAFATSYWTRPTVASIFTSLLPRDHTANSIFQTLPDDIPLLAGELKKAGYKTAGFSANTNISERNKYNRGFDKFHFYPGETYLPTLHHEVLKLDLLRNFDNKLNSSFRVFGRRKKIYSMAEDLTSRALEWLEANRHTKFFIYLHCMEPHEPYYRHPFNGDCVRPLHEPTDENDVDRFYSFYDGEIEYADRQISVLIDYLKETGLYDSTLIIVTADHGEEFFDHYAWKHMMPFMYDELIHIPLIFKLPLSKRRGETDSRLISQIDLAPTILRFIGKSPPESWMGNDYFDPSFSRNEIIAQAPGIFCIRTPEYKWINAIPNFARIRFRGLRYKDLDPRAFFPDRSLFDLIADPREKNNLIDTGNSDSIIASISASYDKEELMTIPHEEGVNAKSILDAETVRHLQELGYID